MAQWKADHKKETYFQAKIKRKADLVGKAQCTFS